MPQDLGPWQGAGLALDSLFKRVPKSTLGALATMLVFAAALRFQPSLPEPYITVYTWIMLVGLAGSMLLALRNLAREK